MTMDWNPRAAAKATAAREERRSRLLPIEIGSERFARTKVVVRNVSPYGLGVRGAVELLACERLTVYLPNKVEIGATVRWVRNGTFGLALDEPINPALLQPNATTNPLDLTHRDANPGFIPLQVNTNTQRPGFIRSHRDEILDGSSHWTSD
jgi:hypothetical protein